MIHISPSLRCACAAPVSQKASVCAPDPTTVTALRLRSAVSPFAASKAGKRVGDETFLKCVTLLFLCGFIKKQRKNNEGYSFSG